MPVFIAGATAIGARVARRVAVSRLSAMPKRIFASVFAVAGATTTRSAHSASEMCSGFHCAGAANWSISTGLRESVWKVSGRTNSPAAGVMTT